MTGHALVTGGAGFIGSHLVDALLTIGRQVTVVDDLSTGRRGNLPTGIAPNRLRFVHADVATALAGPLAEERFDEIYHLAASVGVKLVVDDPARCIDNNIVHTSALIRFAQRRRTPTLIASSSEVYGKSEKSPFQEDDDVVYGPTTVFRWAYAASKAIDEYIALAAHQQAGLPVVVVRFFNTVGPRQSGQWGMVLPRFVSAALRGEPLTVYGDGTQTRCFCDARESRWALIRLLTTPPCHGKVFNLGSDRVISIGQLAEMVVRVTGSASRIVTIPFDQAYASGFEDLMQRRPDLTRVHGAIGFAPTIPLEQTIADVADFLRAGGQ
jgi:UDP-glucose 4-epimerase